MIGNVHNMSENEIKQQLNYLILTAFFGSDPRKEYFEFSIRFDMTQKSSQFGQYDMISHEIEISNPSPNTVDNWKTLIHEVSHHIDWCQRGVSDHSEKFFAVYEKLLWTAMDLGWFAPEWLVLATEGSADHWRLVRLTEKYKKMLQKR